MPCQLNDEQLNNNNNHHQFSQSSSLKISEIDLNTPNETENELMNSNLVSHTLTSGSEEGTTTVGDEDDGEDESKANIKGIKVVIIIIVFYEKTVTTILSNGPSLKNANEKSDFF